MKQNLVPIRPAMTAIAAVIALSSTPLLAQTAAISDAQSAPPVVTVPTPAPEPAAPAAVAQMAAPDVPAPAVVQPAPQPAMKTMSTPVEHVEEATATPTARNVDNAPVHRNAGAAAANIGTSHTTLRKASTAPDAAPVSSKAAPASKTVAPEARETAPQAAAPAPVAQPSAAATTSVRNSSTTEDETLPIAGAIGLGVIAAYAMRRRKHRERDDELLLETPVEAAPVVVAEPTAITPRAAEPAMAAAIAPAVATEAGPDRLPNGFDLSRFGRHTRAAYLGPTPENPSLSLRNRLRRASFFDQREREAAAAGTSLKEPVFAPHQAPPAEADNGQVTIRLAPNSKSSRFGYVLQR
jgi:resuscitation-promoting factor RpfA